MKDDQVQWALVRIPDQKDGLETVRDVMIHWTGALSVFPPPPTIAMLNFFRQWSTIGPAVKKIEAAKKKTHTEAIRKYFEPRHAEVGVFLSHTAYCMVF